MRLNLEIDSKGVVDILKGDVCYDCAISCM